MSRTRRKRRKVTTTDQIRKFWGPAEMDVDEVPRIRPTPDPGALPRSLGPPPLAVNPAHAYAHLEAVYEEGVRMARALAAANGLLATEAWRDDGTDSSHD